MTLKGTCSSCSSSSVVAAAVAAGGLRWIIGFYSTPFTWMYLRLCCVNVLVLARGICVPLGVFQSPLLSAFTVSCQRNRYLNTNKNNGKLSTSLGLCCGARKEMLKASSSSPTVDADKPIPEPVTSESTEEPHTHDTTEENELSYEEEYVTLASIFLFIV